MGQRPLVRLPGWRMIMQSSTPSRIGILVAIGALLAISPMLPTQPPSEATAQPTDAAATRASQKALLPILRRPAATSDQMSIEQASQLTGPRVNLSDVRAIETAGGRGWVIPVPSEDQVCLAIPDRASGYGYSCASTGNVARGALSGTLIDDTRTSSNAAVAVVVAVMPAMSEAVEVRDDGRRERLPVEDGILSTVVDAPRVEFTTPQHSQPMVLDTSPIDGKSPAGGSALRDKEDG